MKLADYIKKNGLKKSFFAEKVGTSASHMSLWLSGRRMPNLRNIIRIQQASNGEVGLSDWGRKTEPLKCVPTKRWQRVLDERKAYEIELLEKGSTRFLDSGTVSG